MDKENWSYKDIENFYDRVRMSLGNTTAVVIPDQIIDYPEKAPFAERTIKMRVPNWETLDEENFKIFESAIIYQTAALFEGIVQSKRIKKKQIPTITLEYSDESSISINGMSLKDLVDLLVSQLNNDDPGSNVFSFRVTKGGCSSWLN